jgi:hypothetical protein
MANRAEEKLAELAQLMDPEGVVVDAVLLVASRSAKSFDEGSTNYSWVGLPDAASYRLIGLLRQFEAQMMAEFLDGFRNAA